SKHRNRCRNCRGGLSPVIVPRSYSMHVHHPAQHSGDSYHTVALTSSTIGSLSLCDSSSFRHFHKQRVSDETGEKKMKNSSDLVIEAKVWSSMIKERTPKIVPRTPIVTPPGEPETINTWELMEGLEDVSPLRSPNHLRSFSFDVVRIQPSHEFDLPKSRFHENVKFDSRVGDDLDPTEHPFHIRIPEMKTNPQVGSSDEGNLERKILGKVKVILYFTSLRGIRKTYED
ncbi:PREDICTED: uncharacterized protein At5g39865-like, partial [Camelina sativa]|uniref:Uncharacterized protein At5g39865-like n=1 Tax=Camelina sativa TaxID=90675 RepID=A0ABM0Y953_CAMSA